MATNNLLMGLFVTAMIGTALSGISVVVKLAVVVLTIAYGLVWWHYAD